MNGLLGGMLVKTTATLHEVDDACELPAAPSSIMAIVRPMTARTFIGVLRAGPDRNARRAFEPHFERAAGEANGDGLKPECGGDRDGARAGRRGLPRPALPHPRLDLTVAEPPRDLDVRAVGKPRVDFEQRADPR